MKKTGAAILVAAVALAVASSTSAATTGKDDDRKPDEYRPDRGSRGPVQDARLAGQAGRARRSIVPAGRLDRVRTHRRGFREGAEEDARRARKEQGRTEGSPAVPRRQGQGHRRASVKAHVGDSLMRASSDASASTCAAMILSISASRRSRSTSANRGLGGAERRGSLVGPRGARHRGASRTSSRRRPARFRRCWGGRRSEGRGKWRRA
jgi:hypothetical protein